MKKKIILFMPSIEGGGVEKNLFIIANYFATKFNKVDLISISKNYKYKFNKNLVFKTLKSNFWDKRSRRLKYFLALMILIKDLISNKDQIVFAFQANIYCIIICKILGKKIIVRSNSAPIGWSKNKIKKAIFRYLLNKADRIIVNSLEFKKDLKKEFSVNAFCIYNPLNKKEILEKSKKIQKKNFKTKNLKILNVGRFVDQKDQITLLKALNLIKDRINFEAIIMGKGILKNELNKFIINNNLKKNVRLISFQDNPYKTIKECDLFILSSTFEGLPNVLLEAASLKKFIISSNCRTGPNEILQAGKGGYLFKVKNYKELSKKIMLIAKKPHLKKKYINITYNSLDRFDLNINLKKYENLIKELI